MLIKFIETSVFTARIREIMPDDEYFRLQDLLIQCPDADVVIKGSGGIRKVRVKAFGRGKRGGARVIYFLGGKRRYDSDARCLCEKRARRCY